MLLIMDFSPSSFEILGEPIIHKKVIDYIQKTVGDNFEYEKLALKKITGEQYQDIQALNSERDIIEHLNMIYPQNCQYIGEIALNELLKKGGKTYNTSSIQVIAIFVGLMFIFGHGCFTDLQFPWISKTLKDDRIVEQNKRFERLFSKTIDYLNHALSNLDRR